MLVVNIVSFLLSEEGDKDAFVCVESVDVGVSNISLGVVEVLVSRMSVNEFFKPKKIIQNRIN
jgi:hypothetical protein